MDPDEGARVMGQLASAFPSDEAFHLRTAREAGKHGIPVLRRLALLARTLDLLRDAANPLSHFDSKSSAGVKAMEIHEESGRLVLLAVAQAPGTRADPPVPGALTRTSPADHTDLPARHPTG